MTEDKNYTNPPQEEEEMEIDLMELFHVFLKKAWLIIARLLAK